MNDTPMNRFWTAWCACRPKLLKLSLHRTGGHWADAEDALSNAMLRALQSFEARHHELNDVEAWLARILLNACTDTLRAWSRDTKAFPLDEDEGELDLTSPIPSPEQLLLEREGSLLLRRHLEALPAHLRSPCVLRFEQGLASAEIARELGLTPVNVRRRLVLAYRQLGDLLGASEREMTNK